MKFKLRTWQISDIDSVAKYANNPRIAENLRNAFPYPYRRKDAAAYVESCITAPEDRQCTRAITVNDEAVGSIGVFFGNDVYCKNAEIGYWLAEPFWGKGIMSAAIAQICGEVFSDYEIERIFAEPYAHNIGSHKALENAGFTLEGILKRSVFKNGQIFDSCVYALLR